MSGTRIAEATGRTDYQWEFRVLEDKQANAFCLPGGKVAVYTGILPITRDDAGLAAVLGHEVSHAIARHGGERLSQQLAVQGGLLAVQGALASPQSGNPPPWMRSRGDKPQPLLRVSTCDHQTPARLLHVSVVPSGDQEGSSSA